MYTFSSKLKTFSFILMLLGVLGIGYGFFSAPKTIQDVETILAADSHGHHDAKHDAHATQKHDAKAEAEHNEHLEHVLHQLQNKPWAAVYVAGLFFMLISLGVLAFYAIQQVAQAGWSPVLFRVMQGITAYLLPGSIIVFILLLLSGFHLNHLFVWMNEGVTEVGHENYDKLIAGKSGYLNFPFWIIRAAIFIAGWNLYRYLSRKKLFSSRRI